MDNELPLETGPSHPILDHPVLCADDRYRCPWALTSSVILDDHDRRWGDTPRTSQGWFEAFALEMFQAGLAPGTAAGRAGALREALCGFHPSQTALLEDDDVDELLLDRRLIRNRAKLVAVIHAARVLQGWDTEDWEFVTRSALEHGTDPAERLAERWRDLGLVHVGVGISRHFLTRTGMLPAHVEGCFRA